MRVLRVLFYNQTTWYDQNLMVYKNIELVVTKPLLVALLTEWL